MNAVLALCAMAFGGVVLGDNTESPTSPRFDQPQVNRDLTKGSGVATPTTPLLPPKTGATGKTAPNRSAGTAMGMGGLGLTRGLGTSSLGTSSLGTSSSGQTPMMPLPPTDPMTSMSPVLPLPPTSAFGTAAGMRGTGASSLRPNLATGSPTAPRQNYEPFSSNAASRYQPNRRPTAPSVASAPGAWGAATVDKPFSAYRAPTGASPWQNLYRREPEGSNNYQSLVRPELEQRLMNRQFNYDLNGLQNQTQYQGQQLQDTQILQGVVSPQYFINYRDYYPGMGQ